MPSTKLAAPDEHRMDLIHSLDGIVWEADAQTLQFLFVSHQAERLLGYPCTEWLNEPDFWRDHIHPDDRDAATAARVASAADKAPHKLEYRMLARDGREIWLRDVVTVHEEEGLPTALRGVMIEITDIRAQARALHRMTQLYAALSHINEAVLLRVKTREDLFAKICEALVEFGKMKMAWIGWNDPATSSVSVANQYGDTHGYLQSIVVRSDDSAEGSGPVGLSIRTGRPCVLNDFMRAAETAPWHGAAKHSGFRAIGAFPIRMGGHICGALAGYSAELDFFGPQEVELLEKAAGHLSFALDYFEAEARRQKVEEALQQSESRFRLMFEDTADAMLLLDTATHRFIDCNAAAIAMLRCTDKTEILSLHPADLSPPQQPDGRRSAEKAEEMISITLTSGSHRFEWIHCSGQRTEFPVEVLLTPIQMGDQQVIVATLRDITERKRDERTQTALHQISEAAQSTANLPELFHRIHGIIDGLLSAKNFFVALYDSDKDELTFPYFVDEFDPAPNPMKLNDGTLSGEVIRTGEALLLNPEGQRNRVERGKEVMGTDSVDWLGVPLKSRSKTIGILVVQTYSGAVRYSS